MTVERCYWPFRAYEALKMSLQIYNFEVYHVPLTFSFYWPLMITSMIVRNFCGRMNLRYMNVPCLRLHLHSFIVIIVNILPYEARKMTSRVLLLLIKITVWETTTIRKLHSMTTTKESIAIIQVAFGNMQKTRKTIVEVLIENLRWRDTVKLGWRNSSRLHSFTGLLPPVVAANQFG